MNLTRRQFGLGVLASIVAVLFGRLFGFGRGRTGGNHDASDIEARYWTPGDHLAG